MHAAVPEHDKIFRAPGKNACIRAQKSGAANMRTNIAGTTMPGLAHAVGPYLSGEVPASPQQIGGAAIAGGILGDIFGSRSWPLPRMRLGRWNHALF